MRLFSRLLLALALWLAAPVWAVPAMWQVGEGDRIVTIYGTVHALPPGQNWLTPAADKAFAAADDVVVEVVFPDQPMVMQSLMMRMGTLPAPVPLASRVPPELRPKLAVLVAQSGLPADVLDRLDSWLVAITLVQIGMVKAGLDPEAGVDVTLSNRAKAENRKLVGLETAEGQFRLFDTLPEAEQRLLLASAVEDAGKMAEQLRALVAAWQAGEIERILKEFDDSSLSPELEQRLFTTRNAAWADWVQNALKQPGRHFMAVGAAHMAGPKGLIAMLEARGLKVRRVE